MFVGGLDYQLNDEEFARFFEQYGKVKSAQIVRDSISGSSRGFGFITFYRENIAQKLINEVKFVELKNRQVDLRSAEPKVCDGRMRMQ